MCRHRETMPTKAQHKDILRPLPVRPLWFSRTQKLNLPKMKEEFFIQTAEEPFWQTEG